MDEYDINYLFDEVDVRTGAYEVLQHWITLISNKHTFIYTKKGSTRNKEGMKQQKKFDFAEGITCKRWEVPRHFLPTQKQECYL